MEFICVDIANLNVAFNETYVSILSTKNFVKQYFKKSPNCSMSDLFHEKVPESFIFKVIDVMRQASWHTFQVLTKRSKRLSDINKKIAWPGNVWVGVSVENSDYTYRIDNLRSVNACLKFISFEPLIGPVNKIDLGGESGPHARPIKKDWVRNIQTQCAKRKVPFFLSSGVG